MNWKKILSLTIGLSLIAAAVWFALPANLVQAQTPTPQPKTPAAAGAKADQRLEKLYQAAQKLLDRQAKNLERAGKLAGNLSDRIAKMKANGKDATALEAALAQLQKNVAQSQSKHDTAATLLKAHAGFDANGQVIDRAAARDTLKDAGEPLRQARRSLVQAMKTIKDAMKDMRQAKP